MNTYSRLPKFLQVPSVKFASNCYLPEMYQKKLILKLHAWIHNHSLTHRAAALSPCSSAWSRPWLSCHRKQGQAPSHQGVIWTPEALLLKLLKASTVSHLTGLSEDGKWRHIYHKGNLMEAMLFLSTMKGWPGVVKKENRKEEGGEPMRVIVSKVTTSM